MHACIYANMNVCMYERMYICIERQQLLIGKAKMFDLFSFLVIRDQRENHLCEKCFLRMMPKSCLVICLKKSSLLISMPFFYNYG